MIYLDNSATTKQYDKVTQVMLKYMQEDFGNPSALYQLGVDTEKAIKAARKQVTDAMTDSCGGALDFEKAGKLYFTSGGTEGDNTAICGAARALRRRGKRIVTSAVEHPAVLECCKRLEEDGFEIVRVGVDEKCRPDMDALAKAINKETILVTLMHVNNETGTIFPIDEVRGIMDANGCKGLLHTDAVQSFGKLPMPTAADMISISGHKINGPKGIGALWVRNGVNLPAFITGGGQESGMRSGTQNVPAIMGLGLAAEISEANRTAEMQRIATLRERLMTGLTDVLDDVLVNSPEEASINGEAGLCCPTVLSVSFKGTRGEVILHTLEQETIKGADDGIYVSTGSACSSNKKGQSHVLTAMGLKDKEIEGTIRFSLGRFNTQDEIFITIKRVTEAVLRFRKLGTFR